MKGDAYMAHATSEEVKAARSIAAALRGLMPKAAKPAVVEPKPVEEEPALTAECIVDAFREDKWGRRTVKVSDRVSRIVRDLDEDRLVGVVRGYDICRGVADDIGAAATQEYNGQPAGYANAVIVAAAELTRRKAHGRKVTLADAAIAAVAAGFVPPRARWDLRTKIRKLIGYGQSAEKRGLLALIDA